LPRLPTQEEVRANPELVISLDVTPPAGYPNSRANLAKPGPAPRTNPVPSSKTSQAAMDAFVPRAPQPNPPASPAPKVSEVPVDLPASIVVSAGASPAPAQVAATPPAGAPVDLPPPGTGQRFMLPLPADETARRTPPESSRIVRDAGMVAGLARWAAGSYLHNIRPFLLLAALLVLPASMLQSCLLAATLPDPDIAVVVKLGATVDFSARKAELAAQIRQAQARGQLDGKAVAELAALSSVEGTLVPMVSSTKPSTGGWLRARLAALIQGFLLLGLALPLALAALALATIDREGGGGLTGFPDVWPILVARAELFLVTLVPAALLVGLGHALFVLPGLVLSLLFIFLPHVVLFEKRGGREALARSIELLRTDVRRALLAFVLFGLVGFAAALLAGLLFPPSGSRAMVFVHFMVADGLAVAALPIPAMVLARLYLDIRARTGAVAQRLSRAARS
jgi:hypothetical protein